MIEIKNLTASVGDKKLLTDFSMEISDGEIVVLSGKNGAGKSTLAAAIMNDPRYATQADKMEFDGRDISGDSATTRALLGIYFAAQNVPEIPGLTLSSFFKHSMNARYKFQNQREISAAGFYDALNAARARLDIPDNWMARGVNTGFSGGEKKRIALLGLILAAPKFAILDEMDAGADAALQRLIAQIVNEMRAAGTSFLIISHQADFVKLLDNPRQIVI